MFKAKESFFDRFEQSFEIFKNNFYDLIGLLLGYKIFAVLISITYIYFFLVFTFNLSQTPWYTVEEFIVNPTIVSFFIGGVALFIFYLLLFIPIFVWTLNAIKKSIKWEKTSIEENLKYWFSNFWNAIKTYWLIFSYIALIPALLIIIWGIINIFGQYQWENLVMVWALISLIWVWYLLFNTIYKWTKAAFWLYSANFNEKYTEEDFEKSTKLSDKKWLRTWLNIFFIWIITTIFMSLISLIIWTILNFADINNWSENLPHFSYKNYKEAWEIIYNYTIESFKSYSLIYSIMNNLINAFLNIIWAVFVTIFTYIFYLRLKDEDNNK